MNVVAMVPSTRRHETVLSITGLVIIDTSYLYTVDKNIAKDRDRKNVHTPSFKVW